MAILFITHDLGVVADVCDRVVVMYAGQVVEPAPAADLFATARPSLHRRPAAVDAGDGGAHRRELHSITGHPPMVGAFPDGCRFHPRCPYAVDACRTGRPATSTSCRSRRPRSRGALRVGELQLGEARHERRAGTSDITAPSPARWTTPWLIARGPVSVTFPIRQGFLKPKLPLHAVQDVVAHGSAAVRPSVSSASPAPASRPPVGLSCDWSRSTSGTHPASTATTSATLGDRELRPLRGEHADGLPGPVLVARPVLRDRRHRR